MIQQLFEELFEVAKERSTRKSRNGICRYLAEAFTDKYDSYFNKERFIRYYKKFVEEKSIPNNPNGEFPDQCAQFLEYENYEDFVMKNKAKQKEKDKSDEKIPIPVPLSSGSNEQVDHSHKKSTSKQDQMKKNNNLGGNRIPFLKSKYVKITIINITVIVILAIFLATDALSKNKERWMAWKGVQYEEVDYSVNKYYRGLLEPYNQQTFETFKKVESPDCETRYFNINGNPILWYYKVGKGNLELYTAPGLHPTNGKTLKAITRYMIQTHICPNY